MKRLSILTALLFALTAPLAVEAQQPEKVFRVGVIGSGSPETAGFIPPFRQRLNELGYIEGQNIILEVRYARGKPELFPALAAELVGLRVDAIYLAADPIILAAMRSQQA